jgi:acyl-CoA thioesterase I
MPLGDSITGARAGAASYRYWLAKDLEAAHVPFDFVGSQHGVYGGSPRFEDFDQDHEGHWGWTTGQVLEHIDEWAAAARPDVVLLHLGTNDVVRDPAMIPGNLTAIIGSLRKVNPRVAVLLARLIPMRGADQLGSAEQSIERVASAQTRAESPVVVVRQDEGFDVETDTYDGIHPNESGEKKMAKRWFEAIRALPHLG